MKVRILAVGKLKEAYWKDAEAEYRKRLRRYVDAQVVEVKDEEALLAGVGARARLVLLDERGAMWSSEEIARRLLAEEEQRGGGRELVFGIGGADGFAPEARGRASLLLAFGRITLPHRLARVVLLEQLYRAYTILRGEPYHK